MSFLNPADFLAHLQRLQPEVSRETWAGGVAKLEIYAALLVKWQKAINLVGSNTLPDLWRRHMLDSAQLLPLLPPMAGADDGAITDFGSGAGFPGLVLAALTERPVQLIDSDVRKCAFLREAAQAMGIGGRVGIHAKRFDALTPWVSPVITARACASLDELLGWSAPFADDRTVFLLLKGAKADEELTAATKHWTMEIERQASITDPDSPQESRGKGNAVASAGTILKLSHLKRQISA